MQFIFWKMQTFHKARIGREGVGSTYSKRLLCRRTCAFDAAYPRLHLRAGSCLRFRVDQKIPVSPVYDVARTKIATTILLQVTYERSWGRMYNISRKEERGALDFNGAGVFVIFANIYHLSEAPSRCSTATILKSTAKFIILD